MQNLDLFTSPAVSLDGYTPKFTREQCRLSYEYDKTPCRRWGMSDEDDEAERFSETHVITIEGQKLYGNADSLRYVRNPLSIVNTIVGERFRALSSANTATFKAADQWIINNYHDLLNSIRYWLAVDHRADLDNLYQNILAMQNQARIHEIIHSLKCLQVHQNKTFTASEMQLLAKEYGMTDDEFANYQGQI